ncbi:MAG: hypothetical protein JSV31_11700 [Desulfobacterales bacterium]|nr:MAG: hypothetical protein JSV31_11700 [Desulfobacterales bacterium]
MAQEDFRRKATANTTINILAALFIIALATVVWSPSLRSSLSLLDNPYIAVLQFDRIGIDQEHDNLTDRLNEDLTKVLLNRNGVFVKKLQPQEQERWRLRHRSNFSYKGKLGYVKQIAEELGVRYILTGRVHKNGDNFRVTAQLIDAFTGDLLWVNRYTDSIGGFSSLKNAVAYKIVDDMVINLVSSGDKNIDSCC